MIFGKMKRKKQKKWIAAVLAGEQITREQAQQILDIQLSWPPEEANLPLIRACWLALNPQYEQEGVPGEENMDEKVEQIIRRLKQRKPAPARRLRPAAVAGLALAAVLMLSLAAQAMGLRVWHYVFGWDDEQLKIEVRGDKQDDSGIQATMPPGYDTGDEFRKALIEHEMYPRLPAFVPEGFVYEVTDVHEDDDGSIFVFAQYRNDDRILAFFAEKLILDENAVMSLYIEKDDEEMEVIEKNGTRFFLYSNLAHMGLDWFERPYKMGITGNITRNEMRELMQSIIDGGI